MTFDFTVKEFILGGGTGTPTFQFYRRGFNLGGSATPSWQDVIISGTTALTLVNAKANGLNYLHIMGNCSQASTPTPSSPVDIKCNNGTIKVKDDELPVGYRRIESIKGDGNLYYDTGEKLYGTDTITITLSNTSTSGQNIIGCYSGTGDEPERISHTPYSTGKNCRRCGNAEFFCSSRGFCGFNGIWLAFNARGLVAFAFSDDGACAFCGNHCPFRIEDREQKEILTWQERNTDPPILH